MMEGLTEGRIVHFVADSNVHRAAIVVNVVSRESGLVDLFVFSMPQDGRGGFFMYPSTPYDESKNLDTWHWIEKA